MAIKRVSKDQQKPLVIPKELITSSEFGFRKRAWDDYYAKARESYAAQRFFLQRDALRAGDIAAVKAFAEEARQELLNGTASTIPMPSFPDPELEMIYGRLGIKEVWDERVGKAQEEGREIKEGGNG